MTIHALKTWPEPFAGAVSGAKRHEWRRDDRGFELGDTLVLQEWNPATEKYTGEMKAFEVTWITRDFGVPVGWCCMTIWPLDRENTGE